MKSFPAILFLSLTAATAHAGFIYQVDRTIEQGTVVGLIETTINDGLLDQNMISAWSFTLTAPNLNGGVPVNISSEDGSHVLSGTAVTATPTHLWYDFEVPGTNNLLFIDKPVAGQPTPFWCIETTNCSGATDMSEHIALYLINGDTQPLQLVGHTGAIAFANAAAIPVPAAIWLFGSGLLGLFGLARSRR